MRCYCTSCRGKPASGQNELYRINIELAEKLVDALRQKNGKPHVVFSSSIQETINNPYGRSKREGRKLLEDWAKENSASFTGMIIPNVYGPFGRPNYNSFIATFCHKLTRSEDPEIVTDNDVPLIYVSSLCKHILADIEDPRLSTSSTIKEKHILPDFTKKVSDMLSLLKTFKEQYFCQGIISFLEDIHDINLFNTFRSYIDMNSFFPYELKQNAGERGVFIETIKTGIGGQVSFSTTKSEVTRGNHYHTRKIERFTVIKGKAEIRLRKIGTEQVYEFYLDGEKPCFVDMPIWFTHNITNIGNDELYTQFWINEWYDPSNPDTFFEKV